LGNDPLDLDGGRTAAQLDGPGNSPTTDAAGRFTWTGNVPPNSNSDPGTRTVSAHEQQGILGSAEGPTLASHTLTIEAAPAAVCKPGQIDFLGGCHDTSGWWAGLVAGLGQWWSGLFSDGRDGLVTRVLNVVLYVDDPTTHDTPVIVGLLATFKAIGTGAIGILIAARAFTIVLGLFTRAAGAGPWLTLVLEMVGVFVAVAALTPVEHAVWGWVGRFIAGSDAHALTPLLDAVKRLTLVGAPDSKSLGVTLEGIAGLVLLIALVPVFVLIELTRLGGYILLEALYVLGPLVVPLLLLRETRGVTLWWLRSTLAITAWPILYLLLIEGGVALVTSFSGDASVFGDTVVRVGLGVALVAALLSVPELAGQATARVVAGAGGIVDAGRSAPLAPARRAQAWLREKLPG